MGRVAQSLGLKSHEPNIQEHLHAAGESGPGPVVRRCPRAPTSPALIFHALVGHNEHEKSSPSWFNTPEVTPDPLPWHCAGEHAAAAGSHVRDAGAEALENAKTAAHNVAGAPNQHVSRPPLLGSACFFVPGAVPNPCGTGALPWSPKLSEFLPAWPHTPELVPQRMPFSRALATYRSCHVLCKTDGLPPL